MRRMPNQQDLDPGSMPMGNSSVALNQDANMVLVLPSRLLPEDAFQQLAKEERRICMRRRLKMSLRDGVVPLLLRRLRPPRKIPCLLATQSSYSPSGHTNRPRCERGQAPPLALEVPQCCIGIPRKGTPRQ